MRFCNNPITLKVQISTNAPGTVPVTRRLLWLLRYFGYWWVTSARVLISYFFLHFYQILIIQWNRIHIWDEGNDVLWFQPNERPPSSSFWFCSCFVILNKLNLNFAATVCRLLCSWVDRIWTAQLERALVRNFRVYVLNLQWIVGWLAAFRILGIILSKELKQGEWRLTSWIFLICRLNWWVKTGF